MNKVLFGVSAFLIFVFWPISFYLANRQTWLLFAASSLVVVLNWVLYTQKVKYHYFIYLILPLLHPAFLFVPIISILFYRKDIILKSLAAYTGILILLILLTFKSFYAYSIFTPDPLAKDTLIKKISLIPNRNLARVYENRFTVPLDKYKSNVFESIDINNYFFAFHPRELGSGQNLIKFSYLALVLFLYGIYYLNENIHKKWLLAVIFSSIFSLALINNQDRYESLLYFPISLVCFYGLKKIITNNNYFSKIFLIIFILISLTELIRVTII
jgi:hypothetical protein